MNDGINVKLKLYGILNGYIKNEEYITVKVPPNVSILMLSEILYKSLCESHSQMSPEKRHELQQIIDSSAFAKEDQVFDESNQQVQLQQNDLLSVIPPVCGG